MISPSRRNWRAIALFGNDRLVEQLVVARAARPSSVGDHAGLDLLEDLVDPRSRTPCCGSTRDRGRERPRTGTAARSCRRSRCASSSVRSLSSGRSSSGSALLRADRELDPSVQSHRHHHSLGCAARAGGIELGRSRAMPPAPRSARPAARRRRQAFAGSAPAASAKVSGGRSARGLDLGDLAGQLLDEPAGLAAPGRARATSSRCSACVARVTAT